MPLSRLSSTQLRRDRLKKWSVAGAVLLPLLWLGENVVGEATGATALLLYLPQHAWGALPLLCGALALRNRRLRLALFNSGAIVFWAWALLGFKLHPLGSTTKDVRIVTYNVAKRMQNTGAYVTQIQRQNPDIICLQESRRSYPPEREGEDPVGEQIAAHFPGWHVQSVGDVTTLSRFPIIESHVFLLRGTRRTLSLKVRTPRGPLRVLNTHISTSFSGQSKYHGLKSQLAEISINSRSAAQARLEQIEPLEKALDADTQTPLVLCGDFNTPPRGLFYRQLCARLNDGFAQSGNGLGLSFPSRFPLLRIDYVWTRGAKATSVRVDDAGASDHRMVVADVELKDSLKNLDSQP